jgi:mannosyltransferase OCH1-like enzyme
MTIPKIIIQTWKTKKMSGDLIEWQKSWKKINPEFEYLFFDDSDCFKFIFKNYRQYLDLYESLNNVEKTDVFRYLALHHYGGIYADIDTICLKPIGPLIDLFPNSVITGIEYEKPLQLLQWVIMSPKKSNVMLELVEEIKWRSWFRVFKKLTLNENELVYWLTGPVMYTTILKNTSESVVILSKGRLGCYDQSMIDRNSYLQHMFLSSWKDNHITI